MQKEHARLKQVWARVNSERRGKGEPQLLQKAIAADYGVTPGLIGAYVNGHEPIPEKWKIRFAHFLGVPLLELWPDFPYRGLLLTAGVSAGTLELALELSEYDPEAITAVRNMLATTRRKAAPKAIEK